MTEDEAPSGKQDLQSFKGRATSGAAWTALGFGGRQLVRLGSNLILTRLLFEEFFGLMALVSVVIVGIQLFSDIGISQAIIQSERDDRAFTDTLWTIEIIRSVAVWLVALVAAGPVAEFYEEPILASLIPIASFSSIIEGFRSTNYFTENRKLQMKRIITLEIGAQAVGAVVMVVWAIQSPTVWSLVAGGLTTAFVGMVWTWIGLPGPRNRLHWDREAAVSLYHFGRWILLSTILMFLVGNADRIIFGKLVTMAVLGVYNIALNLAMLPSAVLSHVASSVVFPVYSRFHHDGPGMQSVYQSVRLPLLIIGGWATAGIVAGGPTIIDILYDPRYVEAGWMLQILVAGPWFGVAMESSNGSALLAHGHTRWLAFVSFAKLIGMAGLIPLGWYLGGFTGAMLGLAASDILRYLVSVIGVLRAGLDGRKQDFQMTVHVAVSGFAGWFAVQMLEDWGVVNPFFHALVIFMIVTIAWLPQHRRLWRRYARTGHLFFAES
ncbi:MAG: lipopolysaccharide biosynthesis protein [Polyangiales bacterium]